MFENVGVLVIFFFLLVIGLTSYFKYQERVVERETKKLLDLKSFQLSELVFNMPELDCHLGGIRINGCVDKIKMEKFKEYLSNNKNKYFSQFGFSRISIEKVYPHKENEIILYANKPLKKFISRQSFLPVLIFDITKTESRCQQINGRCDLGVLRVDYYAE